MIEIKVKTENFKLIPIEELHPHPLNNNHHYKQQIEHLARCIAKTGFRSPIIISLLSGFVVSGHARISAAQLLKMTHLPVIYQDFKDEEEEYAFLTADNAIATQAEIDYAQVAEDILNWGPDFDVDMLGIRNFVPTIEEKTAQLDKETKIEIRECPYCKKHFEIDQARIVTKE
jgi:hypothetical protein